MTQLLEQAIRKVSSLPQSDQIAIAKVMVGWVEAKAKGERPIGLANGMVEVGEDFNDPLPAEELQAWYDVHPNDPLNPSE